MGLRGKDSKQLNITLPSDMGQVNAEITRRAKDLNWTKSKFGQELLRWWFYDQKAPAISSQDQAMMLAGQLAKTQPKK